MIIFIIVLVAKKTLRTLSENKRYLLEQKEEVKLIKLEKLEFFQMLVKKKKKKKKKKNDAKELVVNEEYYVVHDGVVLFEYRRTFI